MTSQWSCTLTGCSYTEGRGLTNPSVCECECIKSQSGLSSEEGGSQLISTPHLSCALEPLLSSSSSSSSSSPSPPHSLKMSEAESSEITEWYRGKNVFITGGTGFLGKVLVEKLLRSCSVRRIYLLMRPKRGVDVHQRLEDIFNFKVMYGWCLGVLVFVFVLVGVFVGKVCVFVCVCVCMCVCFCCCKVVYVWCWCFNVCVCVCVCLFVCIRFSSLSLLLLLLLTFPAPFPFLLSFLPSFLPSFLHS